MIRTAPTPQNPEHTAQPAQPREPFVDRWHSVILIVIFFAAFKFWEQQPNDHLTRNLGTLAVAIVATITYHHYRRFVQDQARNERHLEARRLEADRDFARWREQRKESTPNA